MISTRGKNTFKGVDVFPSYLIVVESKTMPLTLGSSIASFNERRAPID